jgi:diguanylate cyclase (GGDEF)-like protein
MQNLDQQQSPHQRLKNAYIVALSIVAVMTIGTHILTAYITANQQENTQITYEMMRLRSLVYAAASEATEDPVHTNRKLLSQLISDINGVTTVIDSDPETTIYKIFYSSPYLLRQKLYSFIDAVSFKPDQKIDENDVDLIRKSSKAFYINMDTVLEMYQQVIMQQTMHSFRMQYFAGITILIVLFFEAMFIFRPLTNKVSSYHKELQQLALTDTLTGLNNRRAFMKLMEAALDHYHRHHKPFAFALADLDKFKAVNDTYGHHVGDAVLKHYASLLQKAVRAHDALGRIGGEEFAVLFPLTEAKEAHMILERLRKTVMNTPCRVFENNNYIDLNYTSSFGLVCVTSGKWTAEALFHEADKLLYEAKDKGRNCIVMTEFRQADVND